MSLDAILSKESRFSLQVSLDESVQTATEVKPSTLDTQPTLKCYVVDLQGLRDDVPATEDALKTNELLDMIRPDVKGPVSDNSSEGSESLASFAVRIPNLHENIYPLIVQSAIVAVSLLVLCRYGTQSRAYWAGDYGGILPARMLCSNSFGSSVTKRVLCTAKSSKN